MTPLTSTGTAPASGPVDPIGTDLAKTLRALKLSGLTATLPERLALARQQQMGHGAFLELLLSDEVTRRESRSAALRAATAGLDPGMRIETWNEHDDLTYDRTLWSDLTSLRFAEAGTGVLILGPVGVGKTHCETRSGCSSQGRHRSPGPFRAVDFPPGRRASVSARRALSLPGTGAGTGPATRRTAPAVLRAGASASCCQAGAGDHD